MASPTNRHYLLGAPGPHTVTEWAAMMEASQAFPPPEFTAPIKRLTYLNVALFTPYICLPHCLGICTWCAPPPSWRQRLRGWWTGCDPMAHWRGISGYGVYGHRVDRAITRPGVSQEPTQDRRP